jgi:hypothetical protein
MGKWPLPVFWAHRLCAVLLHGRTKDVHTWSIDASAIKEMTSVLVLPALYDC